MVHKNIILKPNTATATTTLIIESVKRVVIEMADNENIGLDANQMPMPMDSAQGLQQFATTEIIMDKPIENEGWYKKYCRWSPTSPGLLEQAEKRVLSYIQTGHKGQFVDIGAVEQKPNCKWSYGNKTEERKIWTVVFKNEILKSNVYSGASNCKTTDDLTEKTMPTTPLVIIHGLCASVGLWALNVDALAENRSVYAIDLLGFGRSSRPKFSRDALEAEGQHVEAIEAWRKEMGLERFVLLGHSMGGFLSASYALKYPERVAHLVLADPWGFPKKPNNIDQVLPASQSIAFKAITSIGQKVNALAVIRAAGPLGPGLIDRVRPDLVHKFEALNQNGAANVGEYIYHCNAQKPTGEEAFRTMMDFFGWAKNPMHERLREMKSEVPLTMIYGGQTWLQQIPPDTIRELRQTGSHVDVVTIPGAGHHVYADNQNLFNSIVNKAGQLADKYFRSSQSQAKAREQEVD